MERNTKPLLGARAVFQKFGDVMGVSTLVPIVYDLYNDALATSSKKSYKTGENHLRKFLSRHPRIPALPFKTRQPLIGTLTLCFFAASLFLKDSIK